MLMQEGHDGTIRDVVGLADSVPHFGVFGERGVLQRLLQDTSRAANTDGPPMRSVIALGDSMMNWTVEGFGTDGIGVPWCYGAVGTNTLNTTAWNVTVYSPTVFDQVVATPIGNLSTYLPLGAAHFVFNGTPVPGGNETVNRLLPGAAITPGALPYMCNQMVGRNALGEPVIGKKLTAMCELYCGPWGTPLECVYISVRDTASVNSLYQSAKVSTYAATPCYRMVSVDIPANHNWATTGNIVIDLNVTQGATPANGTRVVCSPLTFLYADKGINFIGQAVGGWWTRYYVSDLVYTEKAFARFAQWPGRKTLCMQLGQNGTGPGFQTIDQDRDAKLEIIRRFRKWEPDGDVLITTAYRTRNTAAGCSPWKRKSDLEIVRNSYNVCLVDTYNIMPPAEELTALGLLSADGTHLTPAGYLYAQKTLCRTIASAGATL